MRHHKTHTNVASLRQKACVCHCNMKTHLTDLHNLPIDTKADTSVRQATTNWHHNKWVSTLPLLAGPYNWEWRVYLSIDRRIWTLQRMGMKRQSDTKYHVFRACKLKQCKSCSSWGDWEAAGLSFAYITNNRQRDMLHVGCQHHRSINSLPNTFNCTKRWSLEGKVKASYGDMSTVSIESTPGQEHSTDAVTCAIFKMKFW